MTILVSGGAGFIGSHLIDFLLENNLSVVCIDDLSLGREQNIRHHFAHPNFKFIKQDILDRDGLRAVFAAHPFKTVFHLAANSDIQAGGADLQVDFRKTFLTTFHILEAMHAWQVKDLVFASSSAVYGDLGCLLGEDTGPLFPISFYGAAKLASEAYISSAVENFGIKAWIFRFPNVAGERATHGAMFDFINRLEKKPKYLKILGDGQQRKPYLYVKDLISGIVFGWQNSHEKINYFNLGVSSQTSVQEIAEMVVEEMGLRGTEFRYTGGKKGWVGDVATFNYDLTKITRLGWRAARTSNESIRIAISSELESRKGQRCGR